MNEILRDLRQHLPDRQPQKDPFLLFHVRKDKNKVSSVIREEIDGEDDDDDEDEE